MRWAVARFFFLVNCELEIVELETDTGILLLFLCFLLVVVVCVGKGFWCPAATNEVERTRTRRQKKKLWVQGLYRLRRHGGDRVLSCIKSHLVKNLSGPCGHCETKESCKWYDAPHLHLTLGVEHGKVDAYVVHEKCHTDLHGRHCELRFLQISPDFKPTSSFPSREK